MKKTITFRLDRVDYDRLESQAKLLGVSQSPGEPVHPRGSYAQP